MGHKAVPQARQPGDNQHFLPKVELFWRKKYSYLCLKRNASATTGALSFFSVQTNQRKGGLI
jgi:hypothetical protein